MANPKHLAILSEGVEAWNQWRSESQGVRADLTSANLIGANLKGADLAGVDLWHADLMGAILVDADLTSANLRLADLRGSDLRGSKLRHADLVGAILMHADLTSANLVNADLSNANFAGAILALSNLTDANASSTIFAPGTLEGVLGLEAVQHIAPSIVDPATLERTAASLSKDPANRGAVETFLRGAGVPEPIMDAFAMMIASPIEFYSCFISYSHRDKSFARRLYEALQARGIRCWLDEHALLPGDDIKDQIDRGIRIWDKVLLCCSEDSLRSYWVEDEVDKAIEKELQLRKDRAEKVHAIIPLDLDGYLFKGWQDGRASMIRRRLAADFTGWASDNEKFEVQLERVLLALKTERAPDPMPKL